MDSFLYHSLGRPFPPAMDCRNDFPRFVNNQDGKAVGCFDDEKDLRDVCDHRIPSQFLPGNPVYDPDDRGMNLIEEKESETSPFASSLEVLIFPFTCSKPMDEIRNLLQSGNGEEITASCALRH